MSEEADAYGDLELVELVVGRAQLYVDDQKNSDSLLHWKHDVEKQEVRSALQRPKFVRQLVDRIMQVRSALSTLEASLWFVPSSTRYQCAVNT